MGLTAECRLEGYLKTVVNFMSVAYATTDVCIVIEIRLSHELGLWCFAASLPLHRIISWHSSFISFYFNTFILIIWVWWDLHGIFLAVITDTITYLQNNEAWTLSLQMNYNSLMSKYRALLWIVKVVKRIDYSYEQWQSLITPPFLNFCVLLYFDLWRSLSELNTRNVSCFTTKKGKIFNFL